MAWAASMCDPPLLSADIFALWTDGYDVEEACAHRVATLSTTVLTSPLPHPPL